MLKPIRVGANDPLHGQIFENRRTLSLWIAVQVLLDGRHARISRPVALSRIHSFNHLGLPQRRRVPFKLIKDAEMREMGFWLGD